MRTRAVLSTLVICLILTVPILSIGSIRLPSAVFVFALALLNGSLLRYIRDPRPFAALFFFAAALILAAIYLNVADSDPVAALLPFASLIVVWAYAGSLSVHSRAFDKRAIYLFVAVQTTYIAGHWLPALGVYLAQLDALLATALFDGSPIGYFPLYRPGGTYISSTYLATVVAIVSLADYVRQGRKTLYFVALLYSLIVVAKGAILLLIVTPLFASLIGVRQLRLPPIRSIMRIGIVACGGFVVIAGIAILLGFGTDSFAARFYALELLFSPHEVSGIAHGITHRTLVAQAVLREALDSPFAPTLHSIGMRYAYFDNGWLFRLSQFGLVSFWAVYILFYALLPLKNRSSKALVASIFGIADLGLVFSWSPLSFIPLALLVAAVKERELANETDLRKASSKWNSNFAQSGCGNNRELRVVASRRAG